VDLTCQVDLTSPGGGNHASIHLRGGARRAGRRAVDPTKVDLYNAKATHVYLIGDRLVLRICGSHRRLHQWTALSLLTTQRL
jgi:hypothetical protein